MFLQAAIFYLLAGVTVLSALFVVSARNPVHSVLFLILAFFSAAGLFVMLGAEFVAMILVIVYVGAVAVLFLFVVMMLDVNLAELRSGFLQYLPVGALVGIVLLIELGMVLAGTLVTPGADQRMATPLTVDAPTNTAAIGALIYTRYAFVFQSAGMVLLIAMIGAIVLTLRHRPGTRRQQIASQNARRRRRMS